MTRLALGLLIIVLGSGRFGATAWAQGKAGGEASAKVQIGGVTASAEGDAKVDMPSETPALGATPAPERRVAWDDIVVVPRKAFIKSGRVELAPFTGLSLNDVLIRHYALGGDLSYFLSDVFSIGLQGQYFIKERSDREGLVGLQYNRVSTLNRYKYAAALNFGYVAGYGKFSLFNRFIWHWDIFVTAGVGLVWTEIIPRVRGHETFGSTNIAPNFGVGTRFFLNDWLTVTFALRDYVFNDKFEPTDRGQTVFGQNETGAEARSHASSQFVNNIMLYAGVGFYLPTSFQYRTPR